MTGFRRTVDATPIGPRTTATPDRGADTRSTSEQIVEGLTAGRTPRMVARQLELPLDLVLMIIEHAQDRGELDFFELRTANCSAGASCDPDPDSLICAGCPLLPERSLASRKKRRSTVISRVQRVLSRL